MQTLCSLPCEPNGARMVDLMADLGADRLHVAGALGWIEERFGLFVGEDERGDPTYGVLETSWERARVEGEKWWAKHSSVESKKL